MDKCKVDISIIKRKLMRGDYALIAEMSNCSVDYVRQIMCGKRRITDTKKVIRLIDVSIKLIDHRQSLLKELTSPSNPDQDN